MPFDLGTWLLTQSPLVVVLVLALWSGASDKPRWVFGHQHRLVVDEHQKRIEALEKENQRWQTLALELLRTTQASNVLVEKAMGVAETVRKSEKTD